MNLLFEGLPTTHYGHPIRLLFLEVQGLLTAEEVFEEQLFISHNVFELVLESIHYLAPAAH